MAWANLGAGTFMELVIDKTADVMCIGVVHIAGVSADSGELRWNNFTDTVPGNSTGIIDSFAGAAGIEHTNLLFFGYFADVAAGTKAFFPQEDGLTGKFDELKMIAFAIY